MSSPPPLRARRGTARTTMTDVARLAGVAASTVSLYLRQPTQVARDTGERIKTTIDRLNYIPNFAAGGLAAAQSRVVGIVVPSIRNAFFATTVDAMQGALQREGYQLFVGHSEYSLEMEESIVRTSLAWSPAAIVLTGLDHTPATRRLLADFTPPVVEIWETGETAIDMAIGFSHHAVGQTMARHLIERGRRAIAFLGTRLDSDRRARQRAEGYTQLLAARGLSGPLILDRPGSANVEAGCRLLNDLLDRAPGIDAVCCANDLIALGVIFACQRRGIAVPDRLAVIGFGDMPPSPFCLPPLTTIRPPGEGIGREAAAMILRRLALGTPAEEDRAVDLGFELVVRDST